MLEVKIREFVCNFNNVLEEISLSKQNLSTPLDCMKNRKFDIGLVIERIQDSISEEDKRLIYLGDGSGDYCPSLRLKEKDFMMPRKNFALWDLICRDPSLLKVDIHGWSDGEELGDGSGDYSPFISSYCKLQTLSVTLLMRLCPKLYQFDHSFMVL
ncbi:hypothetical protein VIGAN_04053100 [Vigna angularis var. angularis]|uniref:Uncharacterized protein n=2 Tax=Phaseolus angularis TaxID=3914 RepID=A0A0S3RSI1_PHAAN|nr:uncharacterized protein LOC108328410 isoform X2 [Vigna angularis]BAT83391.1 hypothetical protein VIGAN_04053100 [Vigna angularis var. angularis]